MTLGRFSACLPLCPPADSMAIAHHNMEQKLEKSLMLSTTDMDYAEAWSFMGAVAQKRPGDGDRNDEARIRPPEPKEGEQGDKDHPQISCHDPLGTVDKSLLPPFLHYCQFYRAYDTDGNLWAFHKGHVPSYIFDCDVPLLKMPPDNLYNIQTTWLGRREALMICMMYSSINSAVIDYTKQFCPEGSLAHKKKTVRIMEEYVADHVGPRENCGGNGNPRLCFEFAMIEPADPRVGSANVSHAAFQALHGKNKK